MRSGRSILGQVRSDAYADGWAQAGMICHDDAYERGKLDAQADCPKRWPAFLAGVIVAALIFWLVLS